MLRVFASMLALVLSAPAAAGPLTLLSRADPARPSDTAGGPSRVLAVSADGRYTVFVSEAANLLAGVTDTNHESDFFLNQGFDLFLHDRVAGTTVLISHAAGDPTTTADAWSRGASISADGRWVAFTSYAGNLVAGQVEPYATADVFLYDRITGATTLVSHAAGSPVQAGAGCSENLKISADGSRIVFACSATDLVPGQGGNNPNVFLYDRATDTTAVVSHLAGSATAAGLVTEPVDISADGNRVIFGSNATGMVAGEIEAGDTDIYLYDHATGGIALVSHAAGAAATQADDFSYEAAISADGGRVAYTSYARNLVAGQVQGNESYDSNVFLYDIASGTTLLVSHKLSSATTAGNGSSNRPSLSADGRYVAFETRATDLIGGDPAEWLDVFLFDRTTGLNVLVSRASTSPGTPANATSEDPQVSSDGSFVVFRSEATDLLPGPAGPFRSSGLFLWERASGAVGLVAGEAGDFRVATGGSWIAFTSQATGLTPGLDANSSEDVFLYERATGERALVSSRGATPSASAGSSAGDWTARVLSNDGRYIAFVSPAQNLAPSVTDTNSASDVFLYDRTTGTPVLVSHASGSLATAAAGESYGPLISSDGGALLFLSHASDLVPGQTGAPLLQLFLYTAATGAVTMVSHAAGSPSSASDSVIRGTGQYAISQDGSRIAYASYATNLSAGQADTNSGTDVFLWDQATGESVLVSHANGSPAQAADGDSFEPGISADGRYVVFRSYAADLVSDSAMRGGLYLYDSVAGTTTRIAVEGDHPVLSADGRRVAFVSYRDDIVPGQVETVFNSPDVFLWDRASGTTVLASHVLGSPVTTGDHGSSFQAAPSLSVDGRWLAFESGATNLVQGQAESLWNSDVFLFDGDSGAVTLVSHEPGSPATTGNGGSAFAAISADGRFVAFSSFATDLVPGQIDGYSADHFLYDRIAGTLSLISHAPGSEVASGGAEWQRTQISADSAWAVFGSRSPDLVPDDLDGREDLFLHPHSQGADFYTVTPCRLLDTRQSGPALTSAAERIVPVAGTAGTCGIPATTRSVMVNVTVVQPGGNGRLTLYPGDLADPLTSTINFRAGETRANNATLALALDGTGTLAVTPVVNGGGTVHLILDVSGYFQ
jgi:Tol biopolymer transport system component